MPELHDVEVCHPKTSTGDLSHRQVEEIHRQLARVLGASIDAGEAGRIAPERFPEDFLNRRREEGAPCPRGCGGGALYCPRCQRK